MLVILKSSSVFQEEIEGYRLYRTVINGNKSESVLLELLLKSGNSISESYEKTKEEMSRLKEDLGLLFGPFDAKTSAVRLLDQIKRIYDIED